MTEAIYKSKNIDYMSKLKKAVLKGMRGRLPDEKTYTWEYVRKQVTLDDLHTYAVASLGKLVQFPTENLNGSILVVFLNPPSDAELEILQRMLDAYKLPKEEVYITYRNKSKAETKEENELLGRVLDAEMNIIQPRLVLSFGLNFHNNLHTVSDFKQSKLMITYDMDYLFKENEVPIQERKKALWEDVKQLMTHYKL